MSMILVRLIALQVVACAYYIDYIVVTSYYIDNSSSTYYK